MEVAGIRVPNTLVDELITLLRRGDYAATADTLDAALTAGLPAVSLTIDDREAVLATLANPPAGLEALRAVRLQEHVGRVRDGLASWLPAVRTGHARI